MLLFSSIRYAIEVTQGHVSTREGKEQLVSRIISVLDGQNQGCQVKTTCPNRTSSPNEDIRKFSHSIGDFVIC